MALDEYDIVFTVQLPLPLSVCFCGSCENRFHFEYGVLLFVIVVLFLLFHEHECGYLSGSLRKWFLFEFLFFLIHIVDCCAFQLCAARAPVWLFIWEPEKVVPF